MKTKTSAWFVMTAIFAVVFPIYAFAHCDTMDGPVVIAAKQALEKSDVTPALKWVKSEQESEVIDAFQKTLAVRKQSAEAKELADLYFFETLVRIHRASEGEPFTGLKPAGIPVDPIIAVADKSIESGKVDCLLEELTDGMAAEVRHRHQRVMDTKKHADESIAAGRAYVAAYVDYVHYIENLHAASASGAVSHTAQKTTSDH